MPTIINTLLTHTNLYYPISAILKPKEVCGGWVGGGLFDYSVYSWSWFNQKPGRFDLDGTKTGSPPGQDKDQDQELDNNLYLI